MSIHPPPSTDPPSRPPTPDPEEEDEESDQSLTVILVSDLEEEDEYADPAITTSKHESTASPSSEDESPLEPFAEEGGYVEIEPVTQSAYIELGDIQLTQTEIPRLHEPVDEIFHGEYSPVQDTWIRDETAVVSKAAYDGLVTAFEMAFWFVAHAKSMRILPELMCVGMPLGWVNAMTCMITNVLAVHRWLIVIDKNLKPNVFTCWAGPGVRGHVDAARAIYINSRHVQWIVRGRPRGMDQYTKRLILTAAAFAEDIVESLRYYVREEFLKLINRDIMPDVHFYRKQCINRWPSNLGWIWHLKFFGGWLVGLGQLAHDVDGFMQLLPCRGPCVITQIGILVPTGKHYPLTMKLVDDDWIEDLIMWYAHGIFKDLRMVPVLHNPIMPLHNCRVVHSLHKNFDMFYARAQNDPLVGHRDTNDIGTLISTCIPSETRCPESEVFHFDPPLQQPDPLLVQVISNKPENLEKFLCV